jgi:uncharacterized SAM-binding protein YcdF (DUF218 family)
MTFIASKVLWALVQPSNLIVVILVVGMALSWTRWRVLGRRLATVATLVLVMAATLPVGNWLYVPLETRFAVPGDIEKSVDGIILLGGATSPGLTERWGQPALNENSERLVAFVMLARRYPNARLIFAGGSGSMRPGRLREADVVKRVFADIGFADERVIFEARSRNTFENAIFTHDLVRPVASERWLLVTSAFHMPRAVGCFRQAGWKVTAYPAGYRTSGRSGFNLSLNVGQRLRSLDLAVHEWIGLFAYRILGRTSALLPAQGMS